MSLLGTTLDAVPRSILLEHVPSTNHQERPRVLLAVGEDGPHTMRVELEVDPATLFEALLALGHTP